MFSVFGLFDHIQLVDQVVRQLLQKEIIGRQNLSIVVQTGTLNQYLHRLRNSEKIERQAGIIPKRELTPTLKLMVGNHSIYTSDVDEISVFGIFRGLLNAADRRSLSSVLENLGMSSHKKKAFSTGIKQGGVLIALTEIYDDGTVAEVLHANGAQNILTLNYSEFAYSN